MTSSKENEQGTKVEPQQRPDKVQGASYPSDPETPLSPDTNIEQRTGSAKQNPDRQDDDQDEMPGDQAAGTGEAGSKH